MRCASYTRVTSCLATEKVPDNTISLQNKAIRLFLKKRGWKLEEKYSDRKNNKNEDGAFQQMRLDGMARKFDIVVIASIFHCGKSVSFAEDLLLKTFYPAGIHFAIVEDNFCSMEKTVLEIEEYMQKKRLESNVSILRMTEWEREKLGLLDVHDEKYGYLLKDDFTGFIVDEEVVPIIREIFQLLAENMTMQAVADLMNEREVESPAVHLERVGKKNWHATGKSWKLGSVQRILRNTAYIGYWTKMVGGKPQTIKVPAIVEKDIFAIANRNVTLRGGHKPIGDRSDNAFIKQIFDKQSGKSLICRRYTDHGIYQMFHRDWNQTSEGIRYDFVMEEVSRAVCRETEQASWILSELETGGLEKEKNRQIKMLAAQAEELFAELDDHLRRRLAIYQNGQAGKCLGQEEMETLKKMDERIFALNQQCDSLMERVQNTQIAFSRNNPWIRLYHGAVVPEKLTKEEIRKWIDRIQIENLCKVEVVLLQQEWKSYFSIIMEGMMEDGEKK